LTLKIEIFGIISNNVLCHCPITAQDITVAENVFGQDIGTLEGKTTRKEPTRVVTDYVSVPYDILKTHQEIVQSVDVMMINKIMFLVTSSYGIQFTPVTHLETKSLGAL
jgi:hypothetical protein